MTEQHMHYLLDIIITIKNQTIKTKNNRLYCILQYKNHLIKTQTQLCVVKHNTNYTSTT